ncbi:hypothetical protein [Rubritepida flocculans]|uniref:hypothetical protein n=1 Tax=Rubritepida flocculans TaxID=182403 RepID=UPI0012EB0773|nr:hypothetical protein [Rubritepida flocculans]
MVTLRPSLSRKMVGFGALALGPLGLLLPVMPGLPFLALGVWVLRDQYVWAHRGVDMIRRRWPQAIPAIEEREQRALAWFARKTAPLRRVFRRG